MQGTGILPKGGPTTSFEVGPFVPLKEAQSAKSCEGRGFRAPARFVPRPAARICVVIHVPRSLGETEDAPEDESWLYDSSRDAREQLRIFKER